MAEYAFATPADFVRARWRCEKTVAARPAGGFPERTATLSGDGESKNEARNNLRIEVERWFSLNGCRINFCYGGMAYCSLRNI